MFPGVEGSDYINSTYLDVSCVGVGVLVVCGGVGELRMCGVLSMGGYVCVHTGRHAIPTIYIHGCEYATNVQHIVPICVLIQS